MAFQERHLKKINDWIHNDVRNIRASGMSGSARVFFVSRLLAELDRPCLIVLPQAKAANRFSSRSCRVVGPHHGCQCENLREEVIQNQGGFLPRLGCKRCNEWDNPPEAAP